MLQELALDLRQELGLRLFDPLDPRSLAEHLAIPVISVHRLMRFGAKAASVKHFLGNGQTDFSAVTVFRGSRRIIVVNSAHTPGRRSNSISVIPRPSALEVVRREMRAQEAAQHFGVSLKLVEWRLNHAGARIQVRRERRARWP